MILILGMLSACSLERNNPLDPQANPDIKIPPEVTGLTLSSAGFTVTARWHRVNDESIGSYYLYSCMTHNGVYERIAVVEQPSNPYVFEVIYTDERILLPFNFYYYKVSAVTKPIQHPTLGMVGLEGKLSDLNYVQVVE